MKMPWGKHKGMALSSLPSAYLYWLATANIEKYPHGKKVAEEADAEWQFRDKHDIHRGKDKYKDD